MYGGAILAATLDFLIERLAMANWVSHYQNSNNKDHLTLLKISYLMLLYCVKLYYKLNIHDKYFFKLTLFYYL